MNAFAKVRSRIYALITLFALGALVPGGYLGYLAWQSLRYEQALRDKDNHEHYEMQARTIESAIMRRLDTLYQPARGIALTASFNERDSRGITRALLTLSGSSGFPVQQAWVIGTDFQVLSPIPDHSEQRPAPWTDWGVYGDEMARLERLEIAQHKVREANEGYQRLLTKHLSRPQEVALLKMIAATNRKLGETDAAAVTYQRIINEFGDVPDPAGQLAAVVAAQSLASLYQSDGHPERAERVLNELQEDLYLNRWPITEGLLQTLKQSPNGIALKKARTRYESLAGPFREKILPVIKSNVLHHGISETGELFWIKSPVVLALVLTLSDNRHQQSWGYLVFIFDGPTVLQDLREIAETGSLGKELGVRLEAADTVPLAAPKMATVQRTLAVSNPPLQLTLVLPAHDPQQALYQHRVRIFYAILGLSSLGLLTALGLVAWTTRREIQMASLKADFMANVSHQIRTPLFAITHISERLRLGRFRSSTEAQTFYEVLNGEAQRLRQLVEHALDFSRLLGASGPTSLPTVDAREVVREAAAAVEANAKAKGFNIQIDIPENSVWIKGDVWALIQGVVNLLDNAIKYSGESRRIRVSLEESETEAVILVQDFGIGIPHKERKHVFQRFYRGQGKQGSHPSQGVGLGLAIVKEIVDAHHGRIIIESDAGSGTTFRLCFAKSPAPKALPTS